MSENQELEFMFEDSRIYAEDKKGKTLAEIDFPDDGMDAAIITHTYVDNSLRGQGIASDLVQMAVDTITRSGKKVRASCPYAVKWLEKHNK